MNNVVPRLKRACFAASQNQHNLSVDGAPLVGHINTSAQSCWSLYVAENE